MPIVLRCIGATLLCVTALCACDSGTAPMVSFSIALADGRSCRDSGVTTLAVAAGGGFARFVCHDAEAPRTITAMNVSFAGETDLLGLSAEGAVLYRGAFIAADVLGATAPPVVTLFPDAAR